MKKVSKVMSVLIAIVGMMFTGIIIAVTLSATSISIDEHANEQVIQRMKDGGN